MAKKIIIGFFPGANETLDVNATTVGEAIQEYAAFLTKNFNKTLNLAGYQIQQNFVDAKNDDIIYDGDKIMFVTGKGGN